MLIEPVTLRGNWVTLEPLDLHHAEALCEAGSTDTFAYIGVRPVAQTTEAYQEYIQRLLGTAAMCPFAAVLRETGRAVGVTTYMDIRSEHRGLEIGSTWIGDAHHQTAVNPECKYLLLRYAFEQQGAIRVQLKTDGRNLRSQRAIAKLGAQCEGVMRKHMVMPDGYLRDTVMFSITNDEWPQVKANLEQRLTMYANTKQERFEQR